MAMLLQVHFMRPVCRHRYNCNAMHWVLMIIFGCLVLHIYLEQPLLPSPHSNSYKSDTSATTTTTAYDVHVPSRVVVKAKTVLSNSTHAPSMTHPSTNNAESEKEKGNDVKILTDEQFPVSASSSPLYIYIHFHKAGGTTMILYFNKYLKLQNVLQAKSTITNGKDVGLFKGTANGFGIYSTTWYPDDGSNSSQNSRAGQVSFWNALHSEGVDFVSLEKNFMSPNQFHNVVLESSPDVSYNNNNTNIQFITMVRDPWTRFRSTYERELWLVCESWIKEIYKKQEERAQQRDATQTVTLTRGKTPQHHLQKQCYQANTMNIWMDNSTSISLKYQYPRRNSWGGILAPNYYVRMLNGINDQKRTAEELSLGEEHLQKAKEVLSKFHQVWILEDPDLDEHVHDYFNWNRRTDKLPHNSNNYLKRWQTYPEIQTDVIKEKSIFDSQNGLDIELYDYVKNELLG